jgi:4-hydroxy-tetrahydrodipicolinate synthase
LLKDVSCDLETVKRRVALVNGSQLAIINANAAIAYDAMRAGSRGFTGVFTNFHPDLYKWLMTEHASDPALADELSVYLALSAMAEPMGYPKLAKFYHQRLGTFACTDSRAVTFDIHEKFWALDALLDKIVEGTEQYRRRVAHAQASYPAPISGTASSRSYR